MKMPATLTWADALVLHAEGLTFIREYAGPNDGEGVRACQKTTDNAPPDSWCCSFVTKCGTDMFGDRWPLPRSGRCETVRQYALDHGALLLDINQAKRGMQGFTVAELPGGLHAHHTFIVTQQLGKGLGVVTVEGNAANPNGAQSSDGNGAYKGRVRGNTKPSTYGGRTFSPDSRLYHFVDFEKL
jgi:hypothetical protein